MSGSEETNLMIGGNVTDRQWQEVESIVRNYQRSLLTSFNNEDKKRYKELNPILDELFDYAHGQYTPESCPPCDPQAVVCRDHLTDE